MNYTYPPTDNYLTNCINARKMELEGNWHEARRLRKALGHNEDVEAIDLIIEATRKGDEYRSLVSGVYEQYENRDINKYEFNKILTEAHDKVYKNQTI